VKAAVMTTRRDVQFNVEGAPIAAWLFLPSGGSPEARVPAVVMAHGVGAVKEMYLEPFARCFAEAGVAALVFDYRGFGASGGEPRQRVSPRDQIEDYRSALTFMSLQPEIDPERLGVWGTSFSGGHVIEVAAHDPRVKVVVSQVGAMNIREAIGKARFTALEKVAVQERARHFVDGGEVYIANTLPPDKGPSLQSNLDTYEFSVQAQATIAPNWRNEVTLSSIDKLLEYAPARVIELVAPRPLLMILAKDDQITRPESIREAFARAGGPKELIEVEGGHYSVYNGASSETAAKAAAEWFVRHLHATTSAPTLAG
jgi:uncharacterized protein